MDWCFMVTTQEAPRLGRLCLTLMQLSSCAPFHQGFSPGVSVGPAKVSRQRNISRGPTKSSRRMELRADYLIGMQMRVRRFSGLVCRGSQFKDKTHSPTWHFFSTSSHLKSSRSILESHGSTAGSLFAEANRSGRVMRVKRTRWQSLRGADFTP